MRRLVPFSLLAVLIIAAGIFTVLSYSQSRDSGSSVKMMLSCSSTLGEKPSSYVISCADFNSKFTNLHWTHWGDATAYATGEARWNDCTPDCVSGHWKNKPATLWAFGLRNGLYTRLSSNDPAILSSETLSPYPA